MQLLEENNIRENIIKRQKLRFDVHILSRVDKRVNKHATFYFSRYTSIYDMCENIIDITNLRLDGLRLLLI